MCGRFPCSHLDAHLAWPSARQAHPLQPSFFPYPALPHSANARPPQLASSWPPPPPPPPMERSTSLKGGGLGILHLQNPPPWTWATTVIFCRGVWGGAAFSLQRWEPWVFSVPIASPPDTPKPLATTQETVSSISPHSTLLINCSNSERKEERAQTLKPWELVNQELKFKTNALSCEAPPSLFFFFLQFP